MHSLGSGRLRPGAITYTGGGLASSPHCLQAMHMRTKLSNWHEAASIIHQAVTTLHVKQATNHTRNTAPQRCVQLSSKTWGRHAVPRNPEPSNPLCLRLGGFRR